MGCSEPHLQLEPHLETNPSAAACWLTQVFNISVPHFPSLRTKLLTYKRWLMKIELMHTCKALAIVPGL